MRWEEKLEERRMRYQALEGVILFFGVIFSAGLIIALIALLANLGGWLVDDLTQSFAALQQGVTEALIVR